MKNIFLLTLLIICTAVHVYAASAGSNAAEFLRIQPGARAAGMGEVFVALADDANALYWNPAGLADIRQPQSGLTHIAYVQEMNYDFVSYCRPVGAAGTLAVGGLALYSGNIERTTETNLGDYAGTAGSFGTLESAVAVGWGARLTTRLSAGLTLKSVRQQVDQTTASGLAGDVGVKYVVSSIFCAGLAAQNIGAPIAGTPMPTAIKLGGSASLLKHALNIEVESDYTLAGKLSFGVGVESWANQMVAVRLGYNTRTESGEMDGIHAGVGIVWKNMTFDYAVIPSGDLGVLNYISVGMVF
jgi:hypothetical protein